MDEKEALTRIITGNFNGGYGFDMQLLVDAVGIIGEMFKSGQINEVVRCKDCRHRPDGTGVNHDLEFPDDRCPCKCEDYWYSWKPDDNWFCGNGERRE